MDPAETWFFHAPVPKDATAASLDVHALIERAAGFGVACDFSHVRFWDLRIDIAERYRQGRVFIAGDAAHSHPDFVRGSPFQADIGSVRFEWGSFGPSEWGRLEPT